MTTKLPIRNVDDAVDVDLNSRHVRWVAVSGGEWLTGSCQQTQARNADFFPKWDKQAGAELWGACWSEQETGSALVVGVVASLPTLPRHTPPSPVPCIPCSWRHNPGHHPVGLGIWSGSSRPWGFTGGSDGKESDCNARDPGSILCLGRSPGEGNGYLLQYSCLENSMDRGTWWATVHGWQRVRHTWVTITSGPYAGPSQVDRAGLGSVIIPPWHFLTAVREESSSAIQSQLSLTCINSKLLFSCIRVGMHFALRDTSISFSSGWEQVCASLAHCWMKDADCVEVSNPGISEIWSSKVGTHCHFA